MLSRGFHVEALSALIFLLTCIGSRKKTKRRRSKDDETDSLKIGYVSEALALFVPEFLAPFAALLPCGKRSGCFVKFHAKIPVGRQEAKRRRSKDDEADSLINILCA